MVALLEALAVERAQRQQDASEASTKQEVGRVVLGALIEKLNAEPVPNWSFSFEGDGITVSHVIGTSRRQLGRWTVDDKLRLVLANVTTEWITSESYGRVIDEAVRATAKLIVDVELGVVVERAQGAEIVELGPRF